MTLYALYMVQLVLGRTGRTEFNFPATIAALAFNVGLNLLLVPALDIVGAGIALVVSYLVVVALMYRFTQRLFPVPYEWARLSRLLAVSVALVAIGELLLPTAGAPGLAGRIVVWLAYPVTLLAAGFFTDEERRWLRRLRHPAGLSPSSPPPPGAAGSRAAIPRPSRSTRWTKTPPAARKVPEALGPAGEQRLPGMGPVDPGRAAREDGRGEARTA